LRALAECGVRIGVPEIASHRPFLLPPDAATSNAFLYCLLYAALRCEIEERDVPTPHGASGAWSRPRIGPSMRRSNRRIDVPVTAAQVPPFLRRNSYGASPEDGRLRLAEHDNRLLASLTDEWLTPWDLSEPVFKECGWQQLLWPFGAFVHWARREAVTV
jgi:hypothetical protein